MRASGRWQHVRMSEDTLTAFLEARLAEDEATAREAAAGDQARWKATGDLEPAVYVADGGPVAVGPWGGSLREDEAAHIARHDPARVLRDVAAKRAILAMHAEFWRLYRTFEQAGEPGSISLGRAQGLSDVLRQMAAVYASHPDYRAEWKPSGREV
jgi:Family of unknown function (DUF6221)